MALSRKNIYAFITYYDSQIIAAYGHNFFPSLDMMRAYPPPVVETINFLTPLLVEAINFCASLLVKNQVVHVVKNLSMAKKIKNVFCM